MASQETRVQGQTIALAAILQSCYLVDQLAQSGHLNSSQASPLFNGLFQFDASSPAHVYGGLQNLEVGLQLINDVFGRSNDSMRGTVRYSLALLHLERQLSKQPDLLKIIHSRLQHTAKKSDYFTNEFNEIASSLAGVYQDTISTMKYRIQVTGSMQHLQNNRIAEQIRALLLTGVRSAVLWRQMGGSRWRLIFGRRRYIECSRGLLKDL